MKRFEFRTGNVVIVFRIGKTTNNKISNGLPIVQTYTYSVDQFNYIANGGGVGGMFEFDKDNCLNCPLSGTNRIEGQPKCYTHKFTQAQGFVSQIRSIIRKYNGVDNIPQLPNVIPNALLKACKDMYIRFGAYGEPVFIPIDWMKAIADVAKSYTGYTHQWHDEKYLPYSAFLMASTHSVFERAIAVDFGWRCFTSNKESIDDVVCPASSEAGVKSNCAKCGLCSGTTGKGNVNIQIMLH